MLTALKPFVKLTAPSLWQERSGDEAGGSILSMASGSKSVILNAAKHLCDTYKRPCAALRVTNSPQIMECTRMGALA